MLRFIYLAFTLTFVSGFVIFVTCQNYYSPLHHPQAVFPFLYQQSFEFETTQTQWKNLSPHLMQNPSQSSSPDASLNPSPSPSPGPNQIQTSSEKQREIYTQTLTQSQHAEDTIMENKADNPIEINFAPKNPHNGDQVNSHTHLQQKNEFRVQSTTEELSLHDPNAQSILLAPVAPLLSSNHLALVAQSSSITLSKVIAKDSIASTDKAIRKQEEEQKQEGQKKQEGVQGQEQEQTSLTAFTKSFGSTGMPSIGTITSGLTGTMGLFNDWLTQIGALPDPTSATSTGINYSPSTLRYFTINVRVDEASKPNIGSVQLHYIVKYTGTPANNAVKRVQMLQFAAGSPLWQSTDIAIDGTNIRNAVILYSITYTLSNPAIATYYAVGAHYRWYAQSNQTTVIGVDSSLTEAARIAAKNYNSRTGIYGIVLGAGAMIDSSLANGLSSLGNNIIIDDGFLNDKAAQYAATNLFNLLGASGASPPSVPLQSYGSRVYLDPSDNGYIIEWQSQSSLVEANWVYLYYVKNDGSQQNSVMRVVTPGIKYVSDKITLAITDKFQYCFVYENRTSNGNKSPDGTGLANFGSGGKQKITPWTTITALSIVGSTSYSISELISTTAKNGDNLSIIKQSPSLYEKTRVKIVATNVEPTTGNGFYAIPFDLSLTVSQNVNKLRLFESQKQTNSEEIDTSLPVYLTQPDKCTLANMKYQVQVTSGSSRGSTGPTVGSNQVSYTIKFITNPTDTTLMYVDAVVKGISPPWEVLFTSYRTGSLGTKPFEQYIHLSPNTETLWSTENILLDPAQILNFYLVFGTTSTRCETTLYSFSNVLEQQTTTQLVV